MNENNGIRLDSYLLIMSDFGEMRVAQSKEVKGSLVYGFNNKEEGIWYLEFE